MCNGVPEEVALSIMTHALQSFGPSVTLKATQHIRLCRYVHNIG